MATAKRSVPSPMLIHASNILHDMGDHDWSVVKNAWSRGINRTVSGSGKRWTVLGGQLGLPFFSTKNGAYDVATDLILAESRRRSRPNPKAGSGEVVVFTIEEQTTGGLDRPVVKTDRWSAVAFDSRGRIVNLINGGARHTQRSLLLAAKKAWPMAKKVARRPSRKNPTHKVETTRAGRRLRPSAGTVKQASKLLTARKKALAAGETPPTRLGHFDYRAAEWKLQQGRKKAAAKRRRAAAKTAKPRTPRAPAKGRFDTLGKQRKTGSLVDWFY